MGQSRKEKTTVRAENEATIIKRNNKKAISESHRQRKVVENEVWVEYNALSKEASCYLYTIVLKCCNIL